MSASRGAAPTRLRPRAEAPAFVAFPEEAWGPMPEALGLAVAGQSSSHLAAAAQVLLGARVDKAAADEAVPEDRAVREASCRRCVVR